MLIEVQGLEVTYNSGAEKLTVLDIPAWNLGSGEQVAIIGPSGSGKSTFLHILAGLLPATRGRIEVSGLRLDTMSEAARDQFRAKHIGYIFQTYNLLQGYTAIENVWMGMTFSGMRLDKAKATELLARVGLRNRRSHYPSQLSIGEQQRVAVARALAHQPDIILADEPTGALDPRNSKAVIDLLRDVCRERGCSLVIVSHEMQVIQCFEKIQRFLEINKAFSEIGEGS